MKRLPVFSLLVALALGASLARVQAQVFRPETVRGAVLGGVAGAIIGNNSGDLGNNAWRGAAIGTVAGGLIGSAVGETRDRAEHRATQVPAPVAVRLGGHGGRDHRYGYPAYPGRWYGSLSFDRRHGWHGRDWAPTWAHRPVFHARPVVRYPVYRAARWDRPNYAVTGTLLGGLAGAIIGHNDGRHGWEGAAYGAGAGLLLGSWAEQRARQAETMAAQAEARERALTEQAAVSAPAAAPGAPTQVTIINHYYGNTAGRPMTAANGLFGR